MRYNKSMGNKILSLLALSAIGFGVGYILTNSTQFNICIANKVVTDAACINFYERVGDPLFYGMGALTIVFLILLFLPQAFPAWKKFAIWFIPLATLLFIFYPDPGSGDYFSPYPEQVFRWVSGLYVLVSLIIVTRSVIRGRIQKP
ncbi:MAG: hypothetical protein UW83_C0036G0003 [Parcubacteria group bacterium GW2011_GWD1_44_9]|nr:MAG: hypothetical protein UV94_C0023G0004 [Parcubacteria group bacterium GW2011_GWC1_43_30]KKT84774.1 MAG: hypothetical protein UW83_C0036G0003 [Parcubacteria group bacterium GW2011_GWD1_44_9]